MKLYEDEHARKLMWNNLLKLMEMIRAKIRNNSEDAHQYYNLSTHNFIEKECHELLFPLEQEHWPEKFKEIERYAPLTQWPGYTTYSYLMDVIAPPLAPWPLLHFGYAMVNGELIKSTFFVVQQMVAYQSWPQGMVIDPLAVLNNITPAFYVGCIASEQDIQSWMTNKRNPLELYVARREKEQRDERLYEIYMDSYRTQMLHEPGWFPPGLIEFAEKEHLYIPPQDKRHEEDDDGWPGRESHLMFANSLRERL